MDARESLVEDLTDATASIFISSAGRTGTQFFGRFMSTAIEGCLSTHEADVAWVTRPGDWADRLRRFGLIRMTIGRLSPRGSLRALNIARQRGRVSDADAVRWLREQRLDLVRAAPVVFLEANAQYSALLDLLGSAFPGARGAHLVRDPRTWIQSWMNFRKGYYSRWDPRLYMPGARLSARHFKDDPWHSSWGSMDRFARLCWAWDRENRFARQCAERAGESVTVVRFEDVFRPDGAGLHELLSLLCRRPDGTALRFNAPERLTTKRVHSTSAGSFPPWQDWHPGQAQTMDRICGRQLRELGYGTENAWHAMIERSDKGPSSDPQRG